MGRGEDSNSVPGTISYPNWRITGTISYQKQVKMSEIKKPERRSLLSHGKAKHVSRSIRERVLKAAFTLFREHGFSSTSMLDIVTRARVSKRDLYALFNNKHALLAACISERAPEIARTLDSSGHEANQKALTELVRKAQAEGLVETGDPAVLAARYTTVLWEDLLLRLLMRVREAPTAREIEVRACTATETLMALR